MREKLPVLLCQPTDTTIRNISYCPADKIKYDQIREALTGASITTWIKDISWYS